MFQGWRIELREAEEAVSRGQLNEAVQRMQHGDLQQFLPGKRLADRLSTALSGRARQRALDGDMNGGWADWEAARELVGDAAVVLNSRRELVELSLAEVEECLSTGDIASTLSKLSVLEQRGIREEALRQANNVARRMEAATQLSQQGKFTEAIEQLEQIRRLRPQWALITQRIAECQEKRSACRQLSEQMHRVLAEENWSRAVAVADELLALAPDYRLARDARRRAWARVGANVADSRPLPESHRQHNGAAQAGTATQVRETREDDDRFMLWVDAVGGFLVCRSHEVIIGQAVPGNQVHVPIQADLSRRHARVIRRGEGYVIEPMGTVRVAGQLVSDPTLLTDGDEIELAGCVLLRFRQPHALSASARLDFLSRHRPEPFADAVLLMAESCVLGPNLQNHVVCRSWDNDVVLYGRNDQLYCRAMEPIEIDGNWCDGRGPIHVPSRVAGSDFSMSLEGLS